MRMRTPLVLVAAVALATLASACSKPEPTKDTAPAPSASASQITTAFPAIPPGAMPGMGAGGADPHADPHAGMAAPAGSAPAAGGLTWTAPSGWTSMPNPNTMRKATYKVPRAPGDADDAEMAITQVGGDIDSNVTRWVGQFEGTVTPKRTELTVGALKVTIVEITGTFGGGGMGGSTGKKEHWTMLTAIAQTEPAHFFKLIGPEKTVNLARRDFDKFVHSFKAP
ncbi:MAG: hypothetical protein HOO96_35945 [Polyangiaceae bacterium]|nr:hypothetical protein [Polyangiaceae bacterium]